MKHRLFRLRAAHVVDPPKRHGRTGAPTGTGGGPTRPDRRDDALDPETRDDEEEVDGVAKGSMRGLAARLVRERGLVTTAEFEALGISRQYVSVLRRTGAIRRLRHGVYGPPIASCD